MNKIISSFDVIKYIETKYWQESHWLKPDEEGFRSLEYMKEGPKTAVLVQETNDDGSNCWKLRFRTEKVTEDWIQEQCRRRNSGSVVRKVAGGAASAIVAIGIRAGAELLGVKTSMQTGKGAAKGTYDAIAGQAFDEETFRKNCKTYDNQGKQEILHADYDCYDIGNIYSWKTPKKLVLGSKSSLCTANVDEFKCLTFFYDYDKEYLGNHLESITLEFPSRAEAERAYSYMEKYI